jgi:hypothetical protein
VSEALDAVFARLARQPARLLRGRVERLGPFARDRDSALSTDSIGLAGAGAGVALLVRAPDASAPGFGPQGRSFALIPVSVSLAALSEAERFALALAAPGDAIEALVEPLAAGPFSSGFAPGEAPLAAVSLRLPEIAPTPARFLALSAGVPPFEAPLRQPPQGAAAPAAAAQLDGERGRALRVFSGSETEIAPEAWAGDSLSRRGYAEAAAQSAGELGLAWPPAGASKTLWALARALFDSMAASGSCAGSAAETEAVDSFLPRWAAEVSRADPQIEERAALRRARAMADLARFWVARELSAPPAQTSPGATPAAAPVAAASEPRAARQAPPADAAAPAQASAFPSPAWPVANPADPDLAALLSLAKDLPPPADQGFSLGGAADRDPDQDAADEADKPVSL